MTATATSMPSIGQEWPEQGGVFIGSRLIDGVAHQIIIPGGAEFDLVDVEFKDLASAMAERGEINGHIDWRAPDQEDMMLAYINVPDLFDKSDYYWTNKPYGSTHAWAVAFENGTSTTGTATTSSGFVPSAASSLDQFIPLRA